MAFGIFNKNKEKELMKKYNIKPSSTFHLSNNEKARAQKFTFFCVPTMKEYTVKATSANAAIAKLIDKTGYSAKSFSLQIPSYFW